MSELKNKLMPLVYILILCLAAYIVYRTFTFGLSQGEFTGKYNPPVDTLTSGAAKPEEEVYVVTLLQPTPELLAEGKRLFLLNCVSCHGADGKGDGPKAAGLNPPPRNYTEGKFKNGAASLQIFNTISTGLPGSSMASFSFLSKKERMSLAHYVRTFVPNPPENPQALIDQFPKPPGAAVAATGGPAAAAMDTSTAAKDTTKAKAATPAAAPGVKLPLDFAERRIIEEASAAGARMAGEGSAIASPVYAASCVGCHGESGAGLEVAGGNATTGALYYRPRPLSRARAEILESPAALGRFLSEGIAGLPGHRFADLNREQVDELFKALNGKINK